MSLLYPLIQVYRYILQPIAPFTWFGLTINTLDVVAALRLCFALRQLRDGTYLKHLSSKSGPVEGKSFIKNLSTTLLVVYGGEAAACIVIFSIHNLLNHLIDVHPFLSGTFISVPPSFMVSGVYPSLYAAAQVAVDALPSVPMPSAEIELPLSFIDAFSRAYLLCNLIPPPVVTNTSTLISSSPWTLLITSLVSHFFPFFPSPNAYQYHTIIHSSWPMEVSS